MLRTFFCARSCRCVFVAYAGAAVFLMHHVFMAWLKVALNGWYERFYDSVQQSSAAVVASGSGSSGGSNPFEAERAHITALLVEFLHIVLPAAAVHPIAGYIRNVWVLQWRLVLIESYLSRWNTEKKPLEGSAQRVHEDTQRFANGVQACVGALLNATLTLIAFCPILYNLRPVLMYVAVGSAVLGLCISAAVGYKLVGLEIENQVAEGELRSQLVVLELQPHTITALGQPLRVLSDSILGIRSNYRRLYKHFASLSLWLSFFEQFMTILPYFMVAPLLFAADEAERITLGTLVKVANAYGKVFESLNVISDSWLQVNEFRSVVHRLQEFEAQMDKNVVVLDAQPLSTFCISDDEDAEGRETGEHV